ncbi:MULTISPECIES: hypothetical protein [unclassified Streptomyces]|uniref:hypothetical protein n=1 Tax=unclassified Streptomyces TaxID=2593676 RepID=UPI00341E7DDA
MANQHASEDKLTVERSELFIAEMYGWTPTVEESRAAINYLRAYDDDDERGMRAYEGLYETHLPKLLIQWVSALQREDGGTMGAAFVQSLQEWGTHSGSFYTEENEATIRDWATRSVIRYLHATREGSLTVIIKQLEGDHALRTESG